MLVTRVDDRSIIYHPVKLLEQKKKEVYLCA